MKPNRVEDRVMQFERFDVRVASGVLSNKLVLVTCLAAASWIPIVAAAVWLTH